MALDHKILRSRILRIYTILYYFTVVSLFTRMIDEHARVISGHRSVVVGRSIIIIIIIYISLYLNIPSHVQYTTVTKFLRHTLTRKRTGNRG